MDRKPKATAAQKTLNAKRMKAVKGGALNAYIPQVTGEKQSKPAGFFKSVGGLSSESETVGP